MHHALLPVRGGAHRRAVHHLRADTADAAEDGGANVSRAAVGCEGLQVV